MAVDRRLTALRALVARLERLPASTRREWMLAEARGRIVDVETGDAPRAMRPLEADTPERPPEPPEARAANGGAAKRPRSKPGSAAGHTGRAQRKNQPVRTQPLAPEPGSAHRTGNGRASIANPDPSAEFLGTGELLWLEDQAADATAEPGDGSTSSAPWRRGLRG